MCICIVRFFSAKEIQIHAKTIEERISSTFTYGKRQVQNSASIGGRGEKMKKKEEKIGL
jgi:hypothetical protein